MNFNPLFKAAQRPELYTPGTDIMWTDDHISQQLLDIHLSQETDLASRKKPAIHTTLDWILTQVPERPLTILDLGCGPGLYTKILATRGHGVTGMDFSGHSIAHARAAATQAGLDITYLCQDYLTLDHENRYDLIMMIFTDFGVLLPQQRSILLKNIRRALKPGGIFIFDVINTSWVPEAEATWEAEEKGFWRPWPYMALARSFSYETERVYLSQHMVLDEPTGLAVYRFYTHTFSHGQIKDLLKDHGFSRPHCVDGLLPAQDLCPSQALTFCRVSKTQLPIP